MYSSRKSLEHVPGIEEGVHGEEESHHHYKQGYAGERGLGFGETCKRNDYNLSLVLFWYAVSLRRISSLTQQFCVVGCVVFFQVLPQEVFVGFAEY